VNYTSADFPATGTYRMPFSISATTGGFDVVTVLNDGLAIFGSLPGPAKFLLVPSAPSSGLPAGSFETIVANLDPNLFAILGDNPLQFASNSLVPGLLNSSIYGDGRQSGGAGDYESEMTPFAVDNSTFTFEFFVSYYGGTITIDPAYSASGTGYSAWFKDPEGYTHEYCNSNFYLNFSLTNQRTSIGGSVYMIREIKLPYAYPGFDEPGYDQVFMEFSDNQSTITREFGPSGVLAAPKHFAFVHTPDFYRIYIGGSLFHERTATALDSVYTAFGLNINSSSLLDSTNITPVEINGPSTGGHVVASSAMRFCVSGIRLTASQALYSGSSFTPPTSITSLA
jgi:hypothetical protein